MSLQVIVLYFVVMAVVADHPRPYPPPPVYHTPVYRPAPVYHPSEYPDVPPKYTYNYGVSDGYSGANFGHLEARDGYKTEGSYTVDLPDGRQQIVKYVDNGNGLIADVTYKGESVYPGHQPAYSHPPTPPRYA